jgi:hypothetical protein
MWHQDGLDAIQTGDEFNMEQGDNFGNLFIISRNYALNNNKNDSRAVIYYHRQVLCTVHDSIDHALSGFAHACVANAARCYV